MKKSAKIAAIAREILTRRFPLAFMRNGQPKKPLKIGIQFDIINRCEDLTPRQIKAALSDYSSGFKYKTQITKGVPRIDLDGNECGTVTADQEEHAKNIIQKWNEVRRARVLPAEAAA